MEREELIDGLFDLAAFSNRRDARRMADILWELVGEKSPETNKSSNENGWYCQCGGINPQTRLKCHSCGRDGLIFEGRIVSSKPDPQATPIATPVSASEHESQSAPGKFKAYVHKRLDDAGVPTDPYPDRTASTGCRIGCRLDWVIARMIVSPAPESGKPSLPAGYVVPQGYEWTGEVRMPKNGEWYIDKSYGPLSAAHDFVADHHPILRKIPVPAAAVWHYTPSPGVPLCGADDANVQSTACIENVKCGRCLEIMKKKTPKPAVSEAKFRKMQANFDAKGWDETAEADAIADGTIPPKSRGDVVALDAISICNDNVMLSAPGARFCIGEFHGSKAASDFAAMAQGAIAAIVNAEIFAAEKPLDEEIKRMERLIAKVAKVVSDHRRPEINLAESVEAAIKAERERVKAECMALLRHQTQFDAADMVEEFLK